jgi:hypothetical protein
MVRTRHEIKRRIANILNIDSLTYILLLDEIRTDFLHAFAPLHTAAGSFLLIPIFHQPRRLARRASNPAMLACRARRHARIATK